MLHVKARSSHLVESATLLTLALTGPSRLMVLSLWSSRDTLRLSRIALPRTPKSWEQAPDLMAL